MAKGTKVRDSAESEPNIRVSMTREEIVGEVAVTLESFLDYRDRGKKVFEVTDAYQAIFELGEYLVEEYAGYGEPMTVVEAFRRRGVE